MALVILSLSGPENAFAERITFMVGLGALCFGEKPTDANWLLSKKRFVKRGKLRISVAKTGPMRLSDRLMVPARRQVENTSRLVPVITLLDEWNELTVQFLGCKDGGSAFKLF
jgi:hypothetical protein